MNKGIYIVFIITLIGLGAFAQQTIIDFNKNWKFFLGNDSTAINTAYDDSKWRILDLPHDWSIEGNLERNSHYYTRGALPAGIGWYRKTFKLPVS